MLDTETIYLGLGKIRSLFQGEAAHTKTGKCPRAPPYRMLYGNAESHYPHGQKGRIGVGATIPRSCNYPEVLAWRSEPGLSWQLGTVFSLGNRHG